MITITKSSNIPPSLAIEKSKSSGSYNKEDVLFANKRDFFNKCYLCEIGAPTSLNTEHFKPHRGNINLKFDWYNLFYSCAHCNSVKHDKAKYDDILNCTVAADNVETNINYRISSFPKEKPQFEAIDLSERTNKTIELLQEIFYGNTPNQRLESDNLRTALTQEMAKFISLLHEFNRFYYSTRKDKIKEDIIAEIDPTLPFAAFKRWAIRNSEWAFPEFSNYL